MPPTTSKDLTPILVLLFFSSLLLLLDLTGALYWFKQIRSYIAYPLTTVSFTIKSGTLHSFQNIFDGSTLSEENITLKQRILELETANTSYAQDIESFKSLGKELDTLKKDKEYKRSERARVLDIHTENIRGKIKLNRGSRVGIRTGMPVVIGNSYVGYISEVTPYESICITYLIPGQEFVGYILKSKISGILKTEISTIEMTDLLATEQVKLHDVVSVRREDYPYYFSFGTIAKVPANDGSAERKATVNGLLPLDFINYVTVVLE